MCQKGGTLTLRDISYLFCFTDVYYVADRLSSQFRELLAINSIEKDKQVFTLNFSMRQN